MAATVPTPNPRETTVVPKPSVGQLSSCLVFSWIPLFYGCVCVWLWSVYRDCLDQDGPGPPLPGWRSRQAMVCSVGGGNFFRLIWNQFMFWFDGLLLFACFSCFPGHKGSLLFFFPERLSLPSLFPVWWMCGLRCWRLFGFSLWIKLIFIFPILSWVLADGSLCPDLTFLSY